MQIGYNNDVQYRGKTFHIQTEDHGESAAAIETQLFHAGAIFDTSIVSYKNVLEETEDVDERIARIRTVMQSNHKSLYTKLLAGEYDELAGLTPLEDGEAVEADELVPGQERVPESAREIEEGTRDFVDPGAEMGESVDLAEIQAKLKEDAEKAEAAAKKPAEKKPAEKKPAEKKPELGTEESEAAPTMMMSLNDISVAHSEKPKNGGTLVPDFASSGAISYRGCKPPRDDFSILDLVEEFLNA